MHAEMFAEVPFALFCKLALILTLLRLQRRRHCRFRQYLFIGMFTQKLLYKRKLRTHFGGGELFTNGGSDYISFEYAVLKKKHLLKSNGFKLLSTEFFTADSFKI